MLECTTVAVLKIKKEETILIIHLVPQIKVLEATKLEFPLET